MVVDGTVHAPALVLLARILVKGQRQWARVLVVGAAQFVHLSEGTDWHALVRTWRLLWAG